ncbi:hypothetical protein CTEN210_04257 [Chaetoceros tenuissimus]|uniref:Circumsporozoite protein n=1 Tax=Chaetoceros tenuissimus TaxID=426638 RepID=A0AAD3CKL2_9STRA|nr:hypothetical protein CTEN210_04257 [Chaetoceros tenuissimus]
MKFSTVLLAVVALFSPVVQSQKVDPASSSIVGTAKEEDVSPMNSDALSITFTQLANQTTTPLDSIVNKRYLNVATSPSCRKFKYSGGFQYGYFTGPLNYKAVDDGVTTLQAWCESLGDDKKCCSTNGVVGQNDECIDWSTQPDTTYEVCENSCLGRSACSGVAFQSANGSSITFESGSCSSRSSCITMAFSTREKANIRVGENSCTKRNSCFDMAGRASNLEELIVESSSCTQTSSCDSVASTATSLKRLIVNDGECTSSNGCKNCGFASTFSEALQLTETCCAESGRSGTACQYSEPSASPSISINPSNQPSISSEPSDIPSKLPSDQPSKLPSDQPSSLPSDQPSKQPSSIPSYNPSSEPSSEPSWLDDEQCKKKDPENDVCVELDGRCKTDCEDDEDFVCVPGLCSYDKKWDKPTKSPKMRQLMNRDVEMVDMEITATGNTERKLKSMKAPKASKAPKSSCACRVPRRNGCN